MAEEQPASGIRVGNAVVGLARVEGRRSVRIDTSSPTQASGGPTHCSAKGGMRYELIPTLPEPRLLPRVKRFAAMLAEPPVFTDAFGGV